jgi:hypothetical protein
VWNWYVECVEEPINVVRDRHPMGSVALPDCSAEAVSERSQGHAQRSQVTCASGWPPRDSNRAPMVGLLPTAGVQRKIEVVSFRVDESNEADMLVRDVPNVMKETTTNNVADLFDGSLRVDVPKVHCSVTQVVDSSSRRRDSGSSYGLLSKRIGDHIAVGTVQNMGVSGSDAKVLRSVLLLGLGNVCASVLAIVDAPGSLPLGLLGKLRNSLDGIAN